MSEQIHTSVYTEGYVPIHLEVPTLFADPSSVIYEPAKTQVSLYKEKNLTLVIGRKSTRILAIEAKISSPINMSTKLGQKLDVLA